MKILVIGGGGREHALVWKLRQSPRVTQVYCAPGNGGIAQEAECLPADVKSMDSLVSVAERVKPDLTVIGPELPLALGVVDEFQRRGWRTFGPTRAAAQLESSKSFAKEFMQRHRIPTAHYAICQSVDEVRDALPHFHAPLVVKADGLAAGKGVVMAKTREEAATAASEMLSGRMLGEAGSLVVLEEWLRGEELSFLVISDGERVAPLVAAQDHKRIGDGDTGPNTGGMGAYSTQTIIDDKMRDWLVHHIAQPVVAGMKSEGAEFKGVLYCGLMMTARGPMVLEFNCRFGDPETQPILMRMESDMVDTWKPPWMGDSPIMSCDGCRTPQSAWSSHPEAIRGHLRPERNLRDWSRRGRWRESRCFTRRPAIATTSTSLPVGESGGHGSRGRSGERGEARVRRCFQNWI